MVHSLEPQTSWPRSLASGSDTGRRILARDWSRTAMGAIEKWPQSLRTALGTALESPFPTVVMWGPDLFHFYNDAAKPIIGGKEQINALGRPAREVYPELWHMIQSLFLSVLNGKSVWVEDKLYPINRYGFTEEAYFTFSYSPIRKESGEIGGVLCTVMETTRKVINERRSRILHQIALNLSNADTITKACERCLETLSRNRRDLPFCVLRLLRSEDGIAKVMGCYGTEARDRKIGDSPMGNCHPVLEEIVLTKQPVFLKQFSSEIPLQDDLFGRPLPRSVYVMPFFLTGSDEVDGFLSVGLNPERPFDDEYKEFLNSLSVHVGIAISNAKAQEEYRRKLGLLLDASSDHVFMIDENGRYVFLNHAAKEGLQKHLQRLDLPYDSLLDKSPRDMHLDPEFLERFERDQERVFRGETVRGEVLFESEEGPREHEYILSPIKDEFGIVSHIAGITRDVQDLKNAIKVRDQFLSIASHELKTPLTSLKLHVQMRLRHLLRGLTDKFGLDQLKKMFSDDERQINRLTRLVDDMLDISRLNSGKFSLHPEDFALKDLVIEVVERYSSQTAVMNQVINVFGDEVHGHWDRYRIEQVIINLLSNAMKYGARKPVDIEVRREGDCAQLIFRDRGMGIRPEDQQRIFQQFERAVSANEVSGLGLGLYIVRQILDTHGATIKVKSELGEGSEFIVELPLRPAKFN